MLQCHLLLDLCCSNYHWCLCHWRCFA
jgi:hypothetical protein